jgi:hypothetical protein
MAQTFNNGEQLGSIRTVLNDNADEINTLQASKASVDNPAFTGQASFADGTAAAPSIAHTGDLNAGIFFPAADTVSIATNATERMRINSAGNVGIGTTSPSTRLAVSGGALRIDAGDAIEDALVIGAGTSGTTGEIRSVKIFANSSAVKGIQLRAENAIQRIVSLNGGGLGQLAFGNSSDGGTTFNERVRITEAGSVGIGTTSPSAILELNAGTNTDLRVNTSASGYLQVGQFANGAFIGTSSTDVTAGILRFGTGGSENMRISVAGNVGIGTTSPSVKLHVVSSAGSILESLRLQNDSTNATSGRGTQISFRGTSGGLLGTISAVTQTTANDQGGFSFSANGATGVHTFLTNGTERVRIDSSGNVGIGTTAPLAKVHSQVNTFTTADMVAYKAYNNQAVGVYANFQNSATGTAITDGFLIGINDSEDVVLSNYEATNMLFLTSATERMRIDSSGNVGIGTTSPAQKLDVVGNGLFTSGGDVLTLKYSSDAGSVRLAWKNVAGTTLWDMVGGTVNRQDELAIRRAGTSVMYFDNANNVGIGTTSPNAAAILDAQSTTKGVRFPNMTTTQKNAIANVAGLVVFDTTLGKLCVNTGSAWQTITSV